MFSGKGKGLGIVIMLDGLKEKEKGLVGPSWPRFFSNSRK